MRPLCLLLLLPLSALVGRAAGADAPAGRFEKDGIAFLQKHCVGCHGPRVKRADLSLHTFRDEASLLKARKLWQNVVNAVHAGEMPPATRKRPPQPEIDTFLATVKGVFARADRAARPDPGRVTIRRLNRAEYNNTIRDLVGVDFNPAEDFPSDDVGHGFDNIGDVLTLPPVLLERYLAAAESIAQRAIVPDPPKPPQRFVGSRYLQPSRNWEARWRPLDARGNQLFTSYRLTLGGDYVFRARAHAKQTDAEPVKVAVLLGDREVKRFDVTAAEKRPETLEVKLPLPAGDHRVSVKLLNPGGADGRNLVVEWFNLNGPADTRPESHRRLLAVTPGTSKADQTRQVLTRFATRAYRRPATKDEIDRLARLVESAEKAGAKWEAGIQLAVQAVLVSPKFLFRVELDDRPQEAKPHPIDEYHLASRLSYFLWSSMPDDELLGLAGRRQLTAHLDAQVRRMLKDPKASALVENFVLQWLQLRRLRTVAPDARLFPNFTEQLRRSMLRETELFFGEIIREDRSILDILDANYTYLDATLARHYGIRDSNGNRWGQRPTRPGGQPLRGREWLRVTFADDQRGGILTQASVLTVTSNPTRTSPVKRGKWVLEQLLGTPPPPPPPDVPELDDAKAELTGSLRQRMEQHRKNPACASCHARMDPLGFAFENYDAVGAFRSVEGKFPIDASGTLPDGKTFKGAAELKAILKDKKDLFARCLTEKMLTYALGRGLEHYDTPTVDAITTALAKDDYKFSALATQIAKSFPFRMRRGKEHSR